MEIVLTLEQGTIAVLQLKGALDGSNYQDLIAEAQKLYEAGQRDLLLDLSQLTFMSSAGISALHRAALIFRGETLKDGEDGWASYRAIGNDRESGFQQHIKLLNPPERVEHALNLVGFTSFFEIYPDLQAALASFH